MKTRKNSHQVAVYWSSVAAVLSVTVVLHFWRIGTAPAGFYGDECSQAYNAYCIARNGADEYGVRYPLFFRCLDNYQDPLLIYCLVPVVRFFGLTQTTARIPSAFFHILGAVAFGFLVQEYCRNRWLALLGGALFSFIPWIFPMSRLVFSDTVLLFGMVAGWWLLLMALRNRSRSLAAGAGIAWAFAMYARTLGRPMTVLVLLCFGLAFHRSLRARWKIGLVFAISCVAALVPMIISVARFPQSLTTRFERISIFQGHSTVLQLLSETASRYLEYFSPRFLFFSGDPELRHHTGFGGELFRFTIPLILAGVCCVIRFLKTQPYYRLLALSILVYPAAAVLTVDRMHSGRTISGVIPWLLVAMVGARYLWGHRRVGRKVLWIICAAGLVEGTGYLVDYFGPYQTRCSAAFQTGFTKALEYSFNRLGTNQAFYVSGSVGAACNTGINVKFKPYIYTFLLFHGKIDPWSWQHGGFSNTVVRPYLVQIDRPGLLLRCNNTPRLEGTRFLIVPNSESIPADAKLLATFRDETLEYQIFEVK